MKLAVSAIFITHYRQIAPNSECLAQLHRYFTLVPRRAVGYWLVVFFIKDIKSQMLAWVKITDRAVL